jgi:hypothetical protein
MWPQDTGESQMSNEDVALVPLSAEPDDAVGEVLKAVYDGIPGHIVGFVEYHRIEATSDYLKHMQEIRDALAPFGKFKDWCAAAGVNYGALSKALSRRFGDVTPDLRESHSRLTVDAASDDCLLDDGYDHGWGHLGIYQHYAARFPDKLPPAPVGKGSAARQALYQIDWPFQELWRAYEQGALDDEPEWGSEGPTYWVIAAHQEAHCAGVFARWRRFRPNGWNYYRRFDLLVTEKIGAKAHGEAFNAQVEKLADLGDACGLGAEDGRIWGTPGDETVARFMTWDWLETFYAMYIAGRRFTIAWDEVERRHAVYDEVRAEIGDWPDN